ncbi:tRNA-splicing endonuclease subunit Sen2 isoform X2 [Hydra vulgaris]|uniref:tRNA-splicing endonuclease subunit Sen2 n=1 Tax=Hydra vulgaris TaxID=6087 RepID=A0ABM4C6U0_HYDVU
MADEILRKPRRKTKAGLHLLESPFPVPIQTYTRKSPSNGFWYSYFGCLKNHYVCIFRLGDLTFLYRLGFFGKGILSRSRPQFEKYNDVLSENAKKIYVGKYKGIDTDVREIKLLQFAKIQEERLRQHKSWKNSNVCNLIVPKEKVDFIPPQCIDLNSDIDNNLLEELSTDDDMEDIQLTVNLKSSFTEPTSTKQIKLEDDFKLEDDYKVLEYLQLTLEEAFFLSFALGCLSVENESKEAMSITKMWTTYSTVKDDFIQMYIAYHYFRSKGWVVRTTNIYGTDFLLYKDGMPFYHASYSVCVRLVDEENLNMIDGMGTSSWKDLSSISRVNERVAKDVLICYVVKPKDIQVEQLAVPSCIKHFKVIETVLRRWIPEKYRETKT